MRTYIQLSVQQANPPAPAETVKNWLELMARLHPQAIMIPEDLSKVLLERDNPTESLPATADTGNDHAINILASIPRYELERTDAVRTAKYVIHLADTANNTTVWGVVCIDEDAIAIRWRHRSTKSLQYATERLIEKVLQDSGQGKLFHDFEPDHRIPVREPFSTNDAYSGKILGTQQSRIVRARHESKSELVITRGALLASIICTFGGLWLFVKSDPNGFSRWFGGFLDRLATTGFATAAVSYLAYFFRKQDLVNKSIIDWE